MPYLCPSKTTSNSFFLDSFSIPFRCSLSLSLPGFFISSFILHHIICSLSHSHSRWHLSFLVLCRSSPQPSPTWSHFLFSESSSSLLPPPSLSRSVFSPSSSLSSFSTIPFFSNSQFPCLFHHFPPPTKFLHPQLWGSNPSPFGPRRLNTAFKVDVPPAHLISAKITMSLSWYVFGVLDPPTCQSSGSLAFWVLTPKSCDAWGFGMGSDFCLALCHPGKETRNGVIVWHRASHFWLAWLTKQYKSYYATHHWHPAALMKHEHILQHVPSLGEDAGMWSLLCQRSILETGTTSSALLCEGHIVWEKSDSQVQ